MTVITRIDLYQVIDEQRRPFVSVTKYPEGWEGNIQCQRVHIDNREKTLAEMVAWLENNGWTVRRWPGGARAFLGKLHPVRTRREIQTMRRILTTRKDTGDPILQQVNLCTVDLAFDF